MIRYNIRVYLHIVYSSTSSEFYLTIFNLNECILQFKRLSNNMNVVFLKLFPISGVCTALADTLLKMYHQVSSQNT